MNGIGLLFFFTFGLAFALSSTEVERNADEECTRFDDKPGYCVPRNSCSKMVNMIKRIKKGIPLTSDERLYISRSNCTPSKKRYVCCEEEEKLSEAIQNLTTADCGVFGIKKTIGGFEIKLMSRPWLALLYFRSRAGTNAFTCGGTLINQRYILTAAHCFSKQELLSVRLGEHRISQERDCALERGVEICCEAEDFDVERIFVHEKYAPLSGHNDIALVKLARDVTFKDNIKPICLPANEDLQQKINDMEIFHVTGWGKTETTFFSDVPMETVVNRSNRSTCQRSYSRDIVSSQLCAGGVGKDSCNGDSGGPLSYAVYHNGRQRFMQFGVVSFGSQVCGIGHPGVYTNVGSYSRWIAYKIATK